MNRATIAPMEPQTPPPPPRPHVLILPAPAQGHINIMLKLAELLSVTGIRVTFLTTDHAHRQLTHHSDVVARFSRFPGFNFRTITDGLPPAHPRTFSHDFIDMVESFTAVTKPLFKHMLLSGQFGPDLICIILDGYFSFLVDDDDDFGVPFFCFRTFSACSSWAIRCVPKLIQDGQLPIKGKEDMDRIIRNVPGMENILRCRDLPSFCRATDPNDPILQFIVNQTMQSARFDALILNTFEDLEAPILSQTRTLYPKVYPIGPLHALLKTKLSDQQSDSFNNLRQVDQSCLAWLDAQPPKSVIYVSFGSITVMEAHELMEFWHGLVNSGRNFLWVVRPDQLKNGECEVIPAELEEGTRKRGYIVGWAQQEKVLSHTAVGGFLTHSGWNSTLESVVAGKPMICWANAFDQQVNSRFVSHVWKVGLDMKDVCDRELVAKMVNDLMVNRREEFERSSAKIANLARESVNPGGASDVNFDRLVHHLKLLSQQKTPNNQ